MRRHILILLLLALLAGPVCAEDGTEQIERLQQRMENLFATHAQQLIDEQPSLEGKATVALIIGAFVEMGMMGEPDLVKAAAYYEMAAGMGSGDADCIMGNLYYGGAETPSGRIDRDFAKAMEYYHKAAAKDSVAAMLKLGEIYADGMGVEADPKKALVHFMNAAERGDETALRRLQPIMDGAKEWEAKHPGKKANFPTASDQVVKPELARSVRNHYSNLEKLRGKVYVELNRRIAATAKEL